LEQEQKGSLEGQISNGQPSKVLSSIHCLFGCYQSVHLNSLLHEKTACLTFQLHFDSWSFFSRLWNETISWPNTPIPIKKKPNQTNRKTHKKHVSKEFFFTKTTHPELRKYGLHLLNRAGYNSLEVSTKSQRNTLVQILTHLQQVLWERDIYIPYWAHWNEGTRT